MSPTEWLKTRCRSRLGLARRRCERRYEFLETRTLMAVDFASILGLGGSTGGGSAVDVAVDSAGNTFLAGTIEGLVDFDPSASRPDDSDLLNSTLGAGFVAKYASDGSFAWARSMAADPRSLAVDAVGSVFVAGNYTNTAQFGSFTLGPVGADTYRDQFAVKLDAAGDYVWAKAHGVFGNDSVRSIAVDPSGRFVHVLSRSSIGVPGSAGVTYEMMLTQFDAALPANVVTRWSHSVASSWSYMEPNAVALDPAGNVLVTGEFRGTADFDPSSKKLNLSSSADKSALSAFVWKLNTGGAFVWAKNFEGSGSTSYSYGRDVVSDAAGNVVVTGYFFGSPDFDPGRGRLTLPNAGGMDAFVVKVSSAGNLVWGRSFGGAGDDRAFDLASGAGGSVYVSGNFASGADFDPGPGTAVRNDGDGAFVVKLDAAGSFGWVAVAYSGSAAGLAVDPTNGRVHLVGNLTGALNTDPDPNPLSDELFSDGDLFWLTLEQA